MIRDILMVGMGSFVGGTARHIIALAIRTHAGGFPLCTFIVNIVGCLIIGMLWGWTSNNPNFSSHLSLFLGVGICGGFTTFSTFSKESLTLLQSSCYTQFIIYAIGSIIIGILAVALGYIATK